MKTLPQKGVERPWAWALTGPTASGKSAVALAIAQDIGAEVVAVDSVQAVCGFDIGSAKPSAAERAQVPHHLIDITTWASPLDAKAWCLAARAAIVDIHSRNKIPLLVGGTGLYLRALGRGLVAVPSDAGLRAELAAQEEAHPKSVLRRLAELDPESAKSIAPTNLAYLLRALEICLLTKRPASKVRAEHAQQRGAEAVDLKTVALMPQDDHLRAQIKRRCEKMLEAGFVDEVRGLLAQGVDPGCLPMRSVGYKEVACALAAKSDGLALLGDALFARTWHYARRQKTWLRREAKAGCVSFFEPPPAQDLQAHQRILAALRDAPIPQ